MPKYKVSIEHVDYYESELIDADDPNEAVEKYRQMVDLGIVEPVDCDSTNERVEEVDN